MSSDPDFDDATINAVAQAIFESQRSHEISSLKGIPLNSEFITRAGDIIARCDEYTFVIVAFAMISETLKTTMMPHFKRGNSKETKLLFENMGPLSTDASRIRLVYTLGWLPETLFHSIQALRKARNKLAHNVVSDVSLKTEELYAKGSTALLESKLEAMVKAAEPLRPSIASTIVGENRKRAIAFVLAMDTAKAVFTGPSRMRLGLSPTDLRDIFKKNELEENLQSLVRNCIRSIVKL